MIERGWCREIFFLSLSLLLMSCAAGPEIDKYPRAQIDRPFTLPRGVAAWQIFAPYVFASDSSDSIAVPPIPIPLVWKSSLSDTVTLNWFLLPLELSFQLDYSDDHVLGLNAGVHGLGYASGELGFMIIPATSLFYRKKISSNTAIEGTLSADFTYRSGNLGSSWGTGVTFGPRFQLSEFWSVSPAVTGQLVYESFQVLKPAAGASLPAKKTAFQLPLSLSLVWSVGRQWDLGLNYVFRAIGEQNNFKGHRGYLNATHFW